MTRKLFLDDERQPLDETWFVVRNPYDFINYIKNFGCPDVISFDHDLGQCETGYDLAKWLVEQDLEQDGEVIPENFKFFVHSANIVGKKNIKSYLNRYLELKKGNC